MTEQVVPKRRASEPHQTSINAKLNWLRAGVLGANDGIVSVAGLVIGVAAVNPANTSAIMTAGIAGLVAGAGSMAVGEYVSVSTQRDTERSLLEKERQELLNDPEGELEELVGLYLERGLTPDTARTVAVELTNKDALKAHLDIELGIDPDDLTNPWHAAISSFIAFTLGALLPVLMIVVPPPSLRIPTAFAAVVVALALTGWISAHFGQANRARAAIRVVVGGALAMGMTYLIGSLLGVSGIG